MAAIGTTTPHRVVAVEHLVAAGVLVGGGRRLDADVRAGAEAHPLTKGAEERLGSAERQRVDCELLHGLRLAQRLGGVAPRVVTRKRVLAADEGALGGRELRRNLVHRLRWHSLVDHDHAMGTQLLAHVLGGAGAAVEMGQLHHFGGATPVHGEKALRRHHRTGAGDKADHQLAHIDTTDIFS